MSQSNGALLATHVGVEQEFTALGKSWRIARWDRAAWRKILAWVATVLPDPRKAAAEFMAMLPPDSEQQKRELVAQALDEYQEHLSPTSPRVQAVLDSLDGGIKVLEILLKQYQPDVTEDVAYDLLMAYGLEPMTELLKGAAGVAPAPKDDTGKAECPPSDTPTPAPPGIELTPVSSVKPD